MCESVKQSRSAASVEAVVSAAIEGKDAMFACASAESVWVMCGDAILLLNARGIQFDTATIVDDGEVSTNIRLKSGGSVTFKWGGTSKWNPKFRILEDIDLPENTVRGYSTPDLRWDKRGTIPGEPPVLTVWYRVTGAKAKMFLPAGIPLDVKPIDGGPDCVDYCIEAPVSFGKYAGVAKRLSADELDIRCDRFDIGHRWGKIGVQCKSGAWCGIYEAGVALRAMVKNGVRNVVVEIEMESYSRHKQVRAIEFVRNVYKLAGGVCD